jgi:Beta-propeller repeat
VTYGALGGPNKGDGDAWVIKFDGDGNLLWRRQFGTSEYDFAYRVATTDGKLSVVGGTRGALGGSNKGFLDAWVIEFDADGHRLWSRQPGTSGYEFAQGVATDMNGNVYVVGETTGALGGPNKGDFDAWVIKYAR